VTFLQLQPKETGHARHHSARDLDLAVDRRASKLGIFHKLGIWAVRDSQLFRRDPAYPGILWTPLIPQMAFDPTNTKRLRSRFRAEAQSRLLKFLRITREVLVAQDFLGLNRIAPVFQLHSFSNLADQQKLSMFSDWFTATAYSVLVGDGSWLTPNLQQAYASGLKAGATLLKTDIALTSLNEMFQQAALHETQGITDALIQRASRAVADGLLKKQKVTQIFRGIQDAFSKVAEPRLNAMCNQFIVAVHNEARLDQFKNAGVKRVGLIPESQPPKSQQRVMGGFRDARRTGPGSRISRLFTPSASTIGRIARVQRSLEALHQVNVLTAGDDKVCPQCEAIAEDGPYEINEASGLIPAHANCRCAFVPAEDARFADPVEELASLNLSEEP
jgi:hypothetical protein